MPRIKKLNEDGTRAGRTGCWINAATRLAIYLRDEFLCAYCGRNLMNAPASVVTLDHLKPRINGGGNEPANLVCACVNCNSARQDKPWRKYATEGAIMRITRNRRRALNRDLAKAILAGECSPVEALR